MLKLNLGCSDNLRKDPEWVNVDIALPHGRSEGEWWQHGFNFKIADLRERWPWDDSSVDFVMAHDIFEHLPDKIHTLNELYRVLKPGGSADVIVPSTDGRGAFQDPTHVSFWNINSFKYATYGDPHNTRFREAYGIKHQFNIPLLWDEQIADGVVRTKALMEKV